MIVDVWSDMVCPFCYIGKRRLESALSQFDGDVTVRYHSFQLDPSQPEHKDGDIHTMIAQKYNLSYDQARRMNLSLERQAKDDGLDYHMDDAIPANTMDAHRLCHWAAEQGLPTQMEELIMKAYFTDSLNIADHAVLARIAAQAGLNEQAALDMLASDRYAQHVEQDQDRAARLGVRGVPHFVINGRQQISGAQPVDVFVQALNKAKASQ